MITPQFTSADIERMLQEKIAKYEEKIVRILRNVGEKCINEAREYGSYQDRTGNLRSSIGYIVLKDGKPIEKGGKYYAFQSKYYTNSISNNKRDIIDSIKKAKSNAKAPLSKEVAVKGLFNRNLM